jgi:serine/threonine-protein kinase RsbW
MREKSSMLDASQPLLNQEAILNLSFQVKTDLNALDKVLGYFEQLDQPWIPRQDWLQAQLALAEGFTNAVRHAHKGLSLDIPIEINLRLYPQQLEIRIWDRGQPFDLDGFLRQLGQRDTRFSGHGQGLPIIKKIAAHLSYQRSTDQRNCLFIVKKFLPQSEGVAQHE